MTIMNTAFSQIWDSAIPKGTALKTWRTEMSPCHSLRTGTERLPRCQGKRPGPPRPMTLTSTMTKEEESYMW